MKEIKFRYVCLNKHFNKIELVYLTDEDLRIVLAKEIGTGCELYKDTIHHIPSWILSDNCEIKDKQLSIDRKDRNGNEIYEGDIVDCSRYFEPPEIYRVLIKDIKYLPKEMFGSNLNWIEIVGNIHENPELLEG